MASSVALLGDLPGSHEALAGQAWKHGWNLVEAATTTDLKRASEQENLMAVLLNPAGVASSWEEALKAASEAAPGALLIVCWPFSENLPWEQMADAGAFHFLRFPLRESEVRQALGFVWAAKHPRMMAVPARKSLVRHKFSVA